MARHHHLLSSLPALLLPLGLFSAPAAHAGGSYQRSYASARRDTADSSAFDPWVRNRAAIRLPQAAAHADDLVITAAQGVRELVVIDSAVPDKAVFYRGLKPGVDVVEIDASRPGLEQLKQALAPYQGLAALHIVSHAEDGVLHVGSSRVDAQALKQDMDIFASLNGALADGADLLLYGCDLAHGDKGEELLEVIRSNTHLDIAASTNKTGNVEQGGDWELEIQRGEITSALAFSEKSLRDFSAVLAPTTYNSLSFCWGPAAPGYGAGGNGDMCAGPLTSQDGNMVISAAPTAVLAAGPNWGVGYSLITQDSSIGVTSGWLQFSADGTNLSAFKLSSVTRGYTWGHSCQSITVTGTRQSDGTSVSDSLSGAAVPYGNDAVHTPINLADVALTSVQVQFDNCSQHMGFFNLRSFTIEPASINSTPVNNAPPAITGTATVGNSLTSSAGSWTDADGDSLAFTYQWYRADDSVGTNQVAIFGATAPNYTLTTNDAHKYLRVRVTANDGNGGIQTANSDFTQVSNSAPVNSMPPTVSGTATVGNALSTSNGTWSDADGDGRTYSYQWYRADDNSGTNLSAIGGATNASYTLTTADARKYLRVVVTANDGNGGITAANSAYTQVTNSAPVNTVAPAVSGTAVVGNALSTTTGTWTDADGDGLTYTYQWYRADDNGGTNLAAIGGATNASYTLTVGDASKYVRVVVTASDGQGGTQAANSIYTQVESVLPGAPTGVAAAAAPGQAEISFIAPVTTGGSEITRYTATATPGGQSGYCDIAPGSPAGSVCTVTVTGLTNGTSYTFTVRATNTNGVGADSAPSNAVVPRLLQVDAAPGAVPGMAGAATATLSGGGATCTLQPGGGGGFGPASQVPPGFQAPHGQFAFAAVQCAGTVTLTLQYPQPLPASIRFRKPDGAGGWFDPQDAATSLNVTVSPDRRTVIYDITDDGLGDTERTTPGAISDPFVPVLLAAPASGVQGIPTLGTWGLTLLSALAGLLGMRQVRRRLDESK